MLPAQSTALSDHTHARAQPGSVDTGAFATSVYGTTTVAIDPDDAAGAGTAATVSRSDHGHEYLTATAAALTKTATSSEGSSGDGARADHVHATSALPWGIVARQTLTASSSAFSATGATDFSIASVVVDATRLYVARLHSTYTVSAAGRWIVEFFVDSVLTDRLDDTGTLTALQQDVFNSAVLWEPTSGTKTVEARVNEVSGTSTITFNGAADATRRFWIEDIGPR